MEKSSLLLINDHEKIKAVYEETEQYLDSHKELLEEVGSHLWAYHEVGDLVPQTVQNVGSGHYFPYSESYYELENSFELCKQGFYRYSFFALRCVIELAVIGLYFDRDDQAHIDVREWLRSREPTPRFKQTLSSLFRLEYYSLFDQKLMLQQEVKDIYSSLSDAVHVRGYRYSQSAQTRANFNQFNDRPLRQYAKLMATVVKDIIIMMLLKYPIGMQRLPLWEKFGFNGPVGGFLDETSRPAVLTILDADSKETLQDISDNDPDVQEIVRDISAMRDLTEEELRKQRSEMNKTIGGNVTAEDKDDPCKSDSG